GVKVAIWNFGADKQTILGDLGVEYCGRGFAPSGDSLYAICGLPEYKFGVVCWTLPHCREQFRSGPVGDSGGFIGPVGISPDGKWLVYGGLDRVVFLSAHDGRIIDSVPVPEPCQAIAFSSDRKSLVTCHTSFAREPDYHSTASTIRLWSLGP